MRLRLEVSAVFLLLIWLPQSVTWSSAQGDDSSRNGDMLSLGSKWPSRHETGGVWPHSSADPRHVIPVNPVFDFTTIVRRRPDASPPRADPELSLGDMHALSAFERPHANVPAVDGGPHPYEFPREGSPNENSRYMWQQDTKRRSRRRSNTRKKRQRTAFGCTEEDCNRRKSKAAKNNGAQPDRHSSPESASERQVKQWQVLEKLFPLQHPRHHRMLLKGHFATLREELKVFDGRVAYALAMIFGYLGLPFVSAVVALGELCRVLLLGNRNHTHFARKHYYTTAAVLAQAKKLASLYLGPDEGKGTDERKKQKEPQQVSEGKQQGKTDKRRSSATKAEQKEVENHAGIAEDAYAWRY